LNPPSKYSLGIVVAPLPPINIGKKTCTDDLGATIGSK